MPSGDDPGDTAADQLAPDEAFAVLGDETRMGVLGALGELESPVTFSDLYDRSDADDSGAFNYHLDRMVGHFVERTDEGYRLAPAGRRVVESVLSGAVTEHRTSPGPRSTSAVRTAAPPWRSSGNTAAWTWGNLEVLSLASGVCPRCAGTVEWETNVCGSHDAGDGLCPSCEGRYAVGVTATCTNCILLTGGDPVVALAANTDLLALLARNGHNPVDPAAIHRVEAVHGEYEETVHATDPFRATYTFTLDGDSLALTVDEDLTVVETAWGTVD